MLKVALLFLVAAEFASAQTTWKDLKFGMSEGDVRKAYTATFEKKPIEHGEFELMDKDLKLAGTPALATLFFDKNGGLEQIDLTIENPFVAEPNTTSAAGSSLAVVQVLQEKLVEKYGVPTSQEGTCQLEAEDLMSPTKMLICKRLWRSGGQTIDEFWSVKNQRLSHLSIEYKPLANDI